ncbi:ABC transporter ATP-binding protein [Gilliamella apicola]|uniref:ABC transporter ATP-binding protein n=1 Tax=Gilliamella apicola TaxID=1196095 RepID=UPI000A00081A|nr:ABC transporter ATP-binding protein [Gilliamella apicola]ORF44537.1 ABC transporter permease [Gilliamella apicola]ORF48113.1 ABC transporter permease [Gilliamella apicola]ORF49307.1 ABC transporter permease [Gilliamella apicola]ORF51668.1 ABC transporter permease [Gilliamella apicola]ORF54138.1 ABC transporter permease [Gilliamella apicola]
MKEYINTQTRTTKSLLKTYIGLINAAGEQKKILIRSLIYTVISSCLFGVSLVLLYPLFVALEAKSVTATVTHLIIVIVLLVGSFIFKVLCERYDADGYSTLAVTELREKLGNKLRNISLDYLSQFRSGEINYLMMQSVNEAAVFTFMLLNIIITGVVIPLSAAIALLFYSWQLSLMMLLVFPMAIPLYLWRRKAYRRGFSILAEANAKLKGEAVEFVQGLDVLKSTGQTEEKMTEFIKVTTDVANILRIGTKKGEKPNLIITIVIQIGLILIISLGAYLVNAGTISYLLLASVLLIVARSTDVLNYFVQMSSMLESLVIGYEKLQELLNAPSLPEKKAEIMPDQYNIEFERVNFSYRGQEKYVLKDISLQIPENALTALVGASGCGKTTITKLILRFADVKSGSIKIGGIDIRDMSQSQLMSLVSVVFQDVYLFQDTIINNIRMAKLSASDEEVIEVCKQANCHEFIQNFHDGYQTRLNDIGKSLSGGERQRISIARAILKNAPILILDEPTAALDTQNELAVQKVINKLVQGKTVLVIAHRISTIIGAKQIVVIDKGEIVESGTHQQLLQHNGIYKEFWHLQQN